jgi:hypothetical protein
MSYRQRPHLEYGSWLVPLSPGQSTPEYEGGNVMRAYRHSQNQRHGFTRPRPAPEAWDALQARLFEEQQARGISEPPPRPWHHEPDAETVAHPDLRAWDRWYEVAMWADQHGLTDLLPARIATTSLRRKEIEP